MQQRHLDCLTMVMLFLLLLWVAPSLAASKTEPPKEALSELKQKLQSLKEDLNNSQEARKDAADALKESEVAISVANKKLYEINARQQQNKTALAKLEAEFTSTQKTLAEQQQLLSSQFYQQYIHGKQSYVQMILQSQRPSEIARDVHYFSYIAKARAELIRSMQASLTKINELNAASAKALHQVAELQQKQIDERRTLQRQKQKKSKVVTSLSQQINAQRGEIKKLSRDEKRLSELITRLAKIKAAQAKLKSAQRSVLKNKGSATSQNNDIVANNDTLPSNEFGAASFASLKGKLRLPVLGDVTNRFGSSREDSGISWKGLFIRAGEGTEVKSVANGRVVFADWLRGFGNLVIVDHGAGYMSLYGNNQAILKQVGEAVSAGDTIAAVGNTGGNETNGLYYELRSQSKPFDPLSWSRLN
jgi:septal ring factor EnvC (AmiA/AmiB activator)